MASSVEIVLPVLNEERDLPPSVIRLREYLAANLAGYDWRIVIADNGSTDSTPDVAMQLTRDCDRVGYLRLEQRGRGRALKRAWLESDADVAAYMDIDLSTDLEAIPGLVSAIASGVYDLAIGSRLKKGATVIGRSPLREFVSRGYSLLFRSMFFTGLPGRSMRLQGHLASGRRRSAAPCPGQRLVLRHGVAAAGREERLPHRRDTRAVDRRPGQPRPDSQDGVGRLPRAGQAQVWRPTPRLERAGPQVMPN